MVVNYAICRDRDLLNKVIKEDSYPLPRADGPTQNLASK